MGVVGILLCFVADSSGLGSSASRHAVSIVSKINKKRGLLLPPPA